MELMDMLRLVVDVAVLLIAGYIIWDIIKYYKAAAGSCWQRCVAGAQAAASSLWTGFTVMVTMAASGLAYLATLINEPSVATAIQTYAQPKYVAIVMIASAFIIEWVKKSRAS